MATALYGSMAAIAMVCGAFAEGSLFYTSDRAAAVGPSVADALAGFGVGLAMLVLSRRLTRRTRSGEAMARALAEAIGPITRRDAIVLAVLSGVAEELLFRGLLQPLVGWVAASLLFGAAHMAPRRDLWLWTATSMLAGFVLGGLFEVTGNLVAPIVAHFTVNAVNLRWLAAEYGQAEEAPEPFA